MLYSVVYTSQRKENMVKQISSFMLLVLILLDSRLVLFITQTRGGLQLP